MGGGLGKRERDSGDSSSFFPVLYLNSSLNFSSLLPFFEKLVPVARAKKEKEESIILSHADVAALPRKKEGRMN